MKIQEVTDISFQKYGRVIHDIDCSELLREMKDTPFPEDVIYVPSVGKLGELEVAETMQNRMYGGLPIQVGYCNGHNDTLNAVEYHRCSEVDVAVDDIILLVGRQQDVEEDFSYDTSKIEAFHASAGTAVELYATTLHYAPCGVGEQGFRCVIILPRGTNTELTFSSSECGEDRLLAAKNKWLIAHEDAKIEGAFVGLRGENIKC